MGYWAGWYLSGVVPEVILQTVLGSILNCIFVVFTFPNPLDPLLSIGLSLDPSLSSLLLLAISNYAAASESNFSLNNGYTTQCVTNLNWEVKQRAKYTALNDSSNHIYWHTQTDGRADGRTDRHIKSAFSWFCNARHTDFTSAFEAPIESWFLCPIFLVLCDWPLYHLQIFKYWLKFNVLGTRWDVLMRYDYNWQIYVTTGPITDQNELQLTLFPGISSNPLTGTLAQI